MSALIGIANQNKDPTLFPSRVEKATEGIKKLFESASESPLLHKIMKVVIGILIFPLGLYWLFFGSSQRNLEFSKEVGNYWDHVVEYDWTLAKPEGTYLSDSFALACKISGITKTPFKQIFVDNKGGGGLTTWFTLEKGYITEDYHHKMQSGEYNNPETLFIAGRTIGEDAEKQIIDETKRMYGGQLKNAVVAVLTTEETKAINNLRLPDRIRQLLIS